MVDLKAKPYCLEDDDIEWVENTLKHMSMEDKVGQLFCEIVNSAEEDNMDRIDVYKRQGQGRFQPDVSGGD